MAPARKRDYKAEYARQKELRAAEGFSSPYQRRIRGGAGAKPTDPRPEGLELEKRRGHGRFRAFLNAVQPESLIAVGANLGAIRRTDDGWEDVPLLVYTPEGDELEFDFGHITEDELDWLIGELDDYDVDYSPDYDIRALAPA